MLNVGLTGNVASGKSTVAAHFAAWGATVLDADHLVREAQAPGTSTHAAIVEAFGRQALQADGMLDRAWLRRRILHDDDARSRLNGIVHPAVRARRAQLTADAAARGDAILVNDIPLLFEVLDHTQFDLIVLVDAPVDVRRQRLLEHRRLGADEADRLIAAQLPSVDKREKSHVVIDNATSLAALERLARAAWHDIRRAAARAGDAGRGPLLIVVAHGEDLVATMRGTVARYRDAGVQMCVVSATTAPPLEALGELVVLGRTPGSLDPNDRAATSSVTRAMADSQPVSIVTFGPDGLTGDADHRAVHVWVQQALAGVSSPPRLLYFAADPSLGGSGGEPPVFGIDVRPWVQPERAPTLPVATHCRLTTGSSQVSTDMPGREWYREAVTGERVARGLIDPP